MTDNIPKELLENREVIECNFVMMFYKDISLLSDYKNVVNGEDIITKDGMFYYGLIRKLNEQGIEVVDNISIYSFIESNKKIKENFENRGGWETIQEITSLLNTENIDSYYDSLVKSNLLIRLNDAGFNVISNLKKFKNMNSEQVYDFYEYTLSNISVGKIEKIKPEDLSTGYDEYIEEWNKGGGIGFRIESRMLNHQTLGIHKKTLTLHMASIGHGKTTSAIAWYVIPAIEDGNNVLIIANEQDVSEWRQMILSTVLFNKIGKVKGFSRHNMMKGNYEQEHIDKMKEAARWIEKQSGKITFIETHDYSVTSIKKIMTKYSKIGYSLIVVDTLKPEDDSSDRAWGQFSEVAKDLYLQAKNLDIAVLCTAQLSAEAMSRSYLDLNCIAKAKAIAETASVVIQQRPMTPKEKESLKGYTYEGKIKKEVTFDKDKDYIVVFTPKNRFGQVSPQIVMERNMNFNMYKDVCWIECPRDYYKK